jgi:hypothetical protein
MSKVAIQGAATGTGVFTLASPATNTDRTLVLPDEAGTVLTRAAGSPDNSVVVDASGNVGIGTSSPASYGKFVAHSSGGYCSIDSNGFINSTQSLDTATAGGRFSGYSNRGLLGSIKIEQATTGADGGYMAFGTCASGSTSYTERMRIDSAGRVTMPYQPCFYAYALSAVNYNDVIRYDAAAVNRGGHYNATSYRFTAPIAGAYLFTFSIGRADQGSGADRGIRFRVNGSIIYSYNPANLASTGVYHNHSYSVIRELTAGDFVDIATVTGGGSYSTSGNFFCGHLLG